MQQLSPRLRRYVLCVIACGLATQAAAFLLPGSVLQHRVLIPGLALVILSALSYLMPIKLATKRALSLHTALQVVGFILLAPALAAATVACGVFAGNLYRGHHPFNALFNSAQISISVVVSGALYHIIVNGEGTSARSQLMALAVAGGTLYLLSTLIVDGATALQKRTPLLHGWWESHRDGLACHTLLVCSGGAIAACLLHGVWLVPAALAPLAVSPALAAAATGFDVQTLEIAHSIANAIEEKHHYLRGGARRMSLLSEEVARRLGMRQDDCRRIGLAAQLHTISSALLPDFGSLGGATLDGPQELFWKAHPSGGAELVTRLLGLHVVAEVLRYHHERPDGSGYPFGLDGLNIPRESRVLSVCEAYVALTSDRGYRAALTPENAWLVILAGSGSQWDEDAVQALAAAIATEAGGLRRANEGRHAVGSAVTGVAL